MADSMFLTIKKKLNGKKPLYQDPTIMFWLTEIAPLLVEFKMHGVIKINLTHTIKAVR